MAPQLKLTYFDIPARAEPARLALTIGHIPFEDVRIRLEDWDSLRPSMPLNALPILEVNGKSLSQSMAILRYVGRLCDLYPVNNAWEAAQVDEILDMVNDIIVAVNSFSGPPAKLKTFREHFGRVGVPRYWGGLDKHVTEIDSDSPFVFGEDVSIADLCITVVYNLFVEVKYFKHVPKDCFAPFPRLKEVRDSVMVIPEVQNWYRKNPLRP